MGTALFNNQYMNVVLGDEDRKFRPEWLMYYETLPANILNFAFIDPAIGQKDNHDYTGIAVISVDSDANWWARLLVRERLTPTQIVDKIFKLQEQFQCRAIGVETVAYQEALIYMLSEEMKRRKKMLPIKGLKQTQVSKEARILGLVPRFEFGRMRLLRGFNDFEDEYHTFPRGAHDDIFDALASLEELVHYPAKEDLTSIKKPTSILDPNYEKWYIQQRLKGKSGELDETRGQDDY